MSNYVQRFWNDEAGFIISAELVLVLTIGVLGLVVGLSQIQTALVYEMNDLSFAFRSLNQSYATTGYFGCKGNFSGGSFFIDRFVGVHCGVVAGNGYGTGYGNGVVVGGVGGYGGGVVTGAKVVEQSTAISSGVSAVTTVTTPVVTAPCDVTTVHSNTGPVAVPAPIVTSECVPGVVTPGLMPSQQSVPQVLPPQQTQPEHSVKPGKRPHSGHKK